MTIMHWLAGLVSIGLGVYLLVALLAPEKFS
ncbi:K(+)-transporting ATPase subunit F [Nannocystis bainbridge]|uniref:K(+)-transporting ATPase subunit F n=1 Tax=Nannocystis bainbridge TaxID=2995303 RepID=A0ABT5EBF0_9BACT|nr:K(+)-transporting ATPase subunit F [Nannocystis bainbridge]MDC0723190.1 K(+)-transporting ATPase subunit F [Nannocystis bainbridge]